MLREVDPIDSEIRVGDAHPPRRRGAHPSPSARLSRRGRRAGGQSRAGRQGRDQDGGEDGEETHAGSVARRGDMGGGETHARLILYPLWVPGSWRYRCDSSWVPGS
ncbi:hypothetical protein GCM10023147_15590 [Tsukamurella soli]|uniref:Uncharacterized protein n=1 Tax=Tsukamurella soli TaxID=644556 RepID=A0ABP8JEF0_9ACTN